MTIPKLELGHTTFKGRDIVVLTNRDGKYYIKVCGQLTQKGLTAKETIRWFLNAMME